MLAVQPLCRVDANNCQHRVSYVQEMGMNGLLLSRRTRGDLTGGAQRLNSAIPAKSHRIGLPGVFVVLWFDLVLAKTRK